MALSSLGSATINDHITWHSTCVSSVCSPYIKICFQNFHFGAPTHLCLPPKFHAYLATIWYYFFNSDVIRTHEPMQVTHGPGQLRTSMLVHFLFLISKFYHSWHLVLMYKHLFENNQVEGIKSKWSTIQNWKGVINYPRLSNQLNFKTKVDLFKMKAMI